ncbi:hypothetical protein HSBAA_39030 [Vreelandella sulfidaeris]|uniref:Uncharacterized protein n=1 Tax=Vreelandella sulfidaeris TaxID=115553 RepID=A0A455UAI7_9GAMM|nr:hypothetical protein HSBAA_39030 [Halomonas sulfidaeris]
MASLKEGPCIDFINHLIEQTGAMLVINTTSFAVNRNADGLNAQGKSYLTIFCRPTRGAPGDSCQQH